MTTDLDIYCTANVLIRKHGRDAAIEESVGADKFLEEGQTGPYLLWKLIVSAINEIQRKERREGEKTN